MFKCIGVCSKCGKCKNAALMSGANERKAKNLIFPEDFKPDTGREGYGVAFDIGTTTVVGMLWNLKTGELIDAHAESNPQNEFGMDVISRITYCIHNYDGLNTLRKRVTGCLNSIIKFLCDKNSIDKESILKAAACGNTTMSHILTGHSPRSLAFAPFSPEYAGTFVGSAGDIGIDISDQVKFTVLPNIAGHVGGDITAGILASRFMEEKELTMFIDVGTNGEIALTDGERRLTCSTAAGPAFEGASVTYGMRAANGAIEKVIIDDGDVFIRTIGECEPQGICGTGIIDAVAQMLENGIIDKRGRLISTDDIDRLHLSYKLKERLISEGKVRKFILAEKNSGEKIVITQNDIREIQLAKGAISAGVKLMLNSIGKTEVDIDKVIVAGAFGNRIDRKSAVKIGIIPEVEEDCIVFVGNAAGAGVSMAMMSESEMRAVEDIPKLLSHVELANVEDFDKVYAKSMMFKV